MPSTPVIACSSGEATVSPITLGLAPGKVARTTTVGGTTSGYSLIGNWNSEMAPPIRISSGAGEGTLQTIDYDLLALGEALTHDAQAFQLRPQLDGAVLHGVVLIEHQDELLAEIRADRFILDQRSGVLAAADQLEACVEARRETPVGVIEHRTAANGAGLRVDLVVEKIQLAQVWVTVFAGQAEIYRAGIAGLAAGLARQLNVFEEHALIGIEIGVNLVGADQGGE